MNKIIIEEQNKSSIFPLINSNNDSEKYYFKIIENHYDLVIYHYCLCDEKSSFIDNFNKIETDINTKKQNKFTEIKSRKDKILSSKWTNYEIDLSYKFYNYKEKSYEFKTEKLNFLKICESESRIIIIFPAIIIIILASLIVYFSTNNKITNPIISEIKKEGVDEIKWFHGIFFLLISSLFLIIIFYFKEYIIHIFTFIVMIYCFFSSFLTVNYLFKSKFIKGEDNKDSINPTIRPDNNFSSRSKANFDELHENLDGRENNNLTNMSLNNRNISHNIIKESDNDRELNDNNENEFDTDYYNKQKNLDIESNINYSMNPIYNYRNNKILVLLNKKLLKFDTTSNTSSILYFNVKFRLYEIINLILIIFFIFNWYENKNWILNNFFAFTISFVSLSTLTIRRFKTALMFLICIFIYDVFWVFFSEPIFKKNVMVEVALSLIIPIKLELPRFFSNNPLSKCMILGLGDIILPGLIIKYCKNFDYLKIFNNINDKLNYYKLSLILYISCLILAILANLIFAHAQPVLFYIAPVFIIGLITNSIINGEVKDFLNGEKYEITQICVGEIINTEFSKFEEGEINNSKEFKMLNQNNSSSRQSITDVSKNNKKFSQKQNRNFVILDEK